MSKRIEAKYKINRRLGVNLWGRAKSPLNKGHENPPGQHGQRRKKPSDFGTQLMAKQKLKGYYGNIGEKQFRKLYDEAVRRRGDTSENLIELLERRLDAVVYRMKFAPTPFAARQMVNHGHVLVNGKRVNIASYQIKDSDVVSIKEKSARHGARSSRPPSPAERDMPEYLSVDHKEMKGTSSAPQAARRALSGADGTQPGHRILFARNASAFGGRSARSAGRSYASSDMPSTGRRRSNPHCRGPDFRSAALSSAGDALVLQQRRQFAIGRHFAHDVAAADELAFDIELRNGRPIGELLDPVAQGGIDQDIDAFEFDAEIAQDLHDGGRETALRKHRRALHVEHHRIFVEILLDAIENWISTHFGLVPWLRDDMSWLGSTRHMASPFRGVNGLPDATPASSIATLRPK